jgi:catechol 2,3-dioxygenase-like lactoylglutathione lyase family enzyme
MFTAIYRWRVRPGMEDEFCRTWHVRTQKIFNARGSFGSRLHREDDGTYCAIALWPSRASWEAVDPPLPDDAVDAAVFQEAVDERLPTLTMDCVDDLWNERGVAVRMSRETPDLPAAAAFYQNVLGLLRVAEFRNHDGFSGIVLQFGEHCQLELLQPPHTVAACRGYLLVLYAEASKFAAIENRLKGTNVRVVRDENPYWERRGAIVFEDPDGARVAVVPGDWRA